MRLAHRRIGALGGRAFAIVLPPDEPETQCDELCPYCARLAPAPKAVPVYGVYSDEIDNAIPVCFACHAEIERADAPRALAALRGRRATVTDVLRTSPGHRTADLEPPRFWCS